MMANNREVDLIRKCFSSGSELQPDSLLPSLLLLILQHTLGSAAAESSSRSSSRALVMEKMIPLMIPG